MFKQPATIGAILLTTMVVFRTFIPKEQGNVKAYYQRDADEDFTIRNLSVINEHNVEELILKPKTAEILDVKSDFLAEMHKRSQQKKPANQSQYVSDETAHLIVKSPEAIPIKEKAESEHAFSLDSENTINSNMSLLFPRQEIQSRSNHIRSNQ